MYALLTYLFLQMVAHVSAADADRHAVVAVARGASALRPGRLVAWSSRRLDVPT
jgi:hypothetical protein